jgi:Tfp pilus assembly protein PilV
MVCALMVGVAVTGVLAGAARYHGQFGQSVADQRALQYARLLVEEWRAEPLTAPDWQTGVHPASPGKVPDSGWTWTVTVTDVEDPLSPGGAVGTLRYKKAVAKVSYRDRSASLETIKW